jgi:heme/copper-type cytochrome/quinol oxidase subunit 2
VSIPLALRKPRRAVLLICALMLVAAAGRPSAQQPKREFSVSGHKYGYRVSGASGAEIRVTQGDLVKIVFDAEDIPHSFTMDRDSPYRIMKRAEPGRPVTIEFLADTPGTFAFFCNLPIDERCQRETRGTLIVEKKKSE